MAAPILRSAGRSPVRRSKLTEEERDVEKDGAGLNHDAGMEAVIPLSDDNEHPSVEQTPMNKAQRAEDADDGAFPLPQRDPGHETAR